MKVSRRKFTQIMGCAAVGAGIITASSGNAFAQKNFGDGLFAIPGGAYSDPLLTYTSETFTPFIGTVFQVKGLGSRKTSLQLTEVVKKDNASAKRGRPSGDRFSLIFQSVGRDSLPSAIHQIEHPNMGNLAMHFGSVDRSGKLYEAVFYRI